MAFADNPIVQELLAGVKALRQNPQASPHLPYPTDDGKERASLLEFARKAPLVYGYWRAWKWLYKQAEAANDAELLGAMMARLDAMPLAAQSSSGQKRHFLTNRQIYDIEVQGNLACVTAPGNWREQNKLFTADISDPLTPKQLGSLEIPEATALKIEGDFVYVLAYSRYRAQGGLRVVNISDPKKPVLVGSLDFGDAKFLEVKDGFAFVLEEKNPGSRSGVRIIDVRDPARPDSKEFITIPKANRAVARGSYLYVTASGGGFNWSLLPTPPGLHVYDISNPTRPKRVHHLKLDNAQAVAAGENALYLLAGQSENRPQIHVLDLADPARPRITGTCGGFEKYAYGDSGFFLLPNGDSVYILSQYTATSVIHVADPANPRVNATLRNMQLNAIALAGEFALATQGYWGVITLDISNPAAPAKLGDSPGANTIGYMKRRSRRHLRNLAKSDPARYVETAYAMLAEPLRERRELDAPLHWVTMDTLFGNSDRYQEQGHGRRGYKLANPRFVFRRREDRCPDAWNARPDLALKLFTASGVSTPVREFALKVLQQTKTPVPALSKEALSNALKSNSLLIQSLATRQAIARLQASEKFEPALLARIYFYANATQRKNVEIALASIDTISGWRSSFTGHLLPLASPDTSAQTMSRRQSGAIALLARRYPEAVTGNQIRTLLNSLLASGRPELSQLALQTLRNLKPSEARDFVGILENCPDPWRERAVAAMEEGMRGKAFEYREASALIHGYSYFYEYLGYQAKTVFYQETAWRLLLAATATKDSVIEQIGREVLSLKEDAPELLGALQSPAALILLARIPANMARLIERVQQEPRLAALLTADTFAVMARNLSGPAMLTLIRSASDEKWAEIREACVAGLREGGQLVAFWRAVMEFATDDELIQRRIFQDTLVAHSFLAVEDTEFFRASDPAFEALLLRWAQVHNDLFAEGSSLLITAATHPLPEIRAWGLARARAFGLTLPFSLRLLESEVPASVAAGKTFFEAVAPASPQSFDYALALCDSPAKSVRRYGMEYAESRWDSLPTAMLLVRLGESSKTDVQTFVASKLLQTDAPQVETQEFDRQVLRARHRGRRAKEMVKQRVAATPDGDVPMLLELARSRTPRDAEWAMQQLAKLALEGVEIEGFELV